MADFMSELLKDKGVPESVSAKPVIAKTETSVEVTKWVDGEKTKETKQIKEEKAQVETKLFREKTIYVSYDLGATVSLGNFNMGKVNVSLSMPVGTEVTPELAQKIGGTYDFIKRFVEAKVEAEVKELIKMRDSS